MSGKGPSVTLTTASLAGWHCDVTRTIMYRGRRMQKITLKGEIGVLQKAVFEVKYDYGFRYLDVCGSVLNVIQKEQEEWILPGDSNPQGGSLFSLANGAILTFSAAKIDLSIERASGKGLLEQEDIDHFIAQIDSVPHIIIDRLGVSSFTRLGFRALYLFPHEDMRSSEDWLLRLGAYSFNSELVAAFGGGIEVTGSLIVISGKAAKYRIALNGVERQAQIDFGQGLLNVQARTLHTKQKEHLAKQLEVKRRMRQDPEFAVQLNIDCSIDDPKDYEGSRFIHDSVSEYTSKLESVFKAGRS